MAEEQAKNERKPYVAIFGDDKDRFVTKTIWSLMSGHELKLSSVNSIAELEGIAPDAVLIFIVFQEDSDQHITLARQLMREPRVVSDIVALTTAAALEERIKILANGFDAIFNIDFMEYPSFKQVLLNRVEKGFARLENRIQQEEYRRFKAALAASPDAFIVFDQNNKIFFVSEHYKNAYPRSGPRLVRGLDVMDAFSMCAEEQGVNENDPRYDMMRDFWQNIDGEIDFKLDDGRIWHLKAKKLPDGQGTIVTTIDITRYKNQQQELEEKTEKLSGALETEKEASAIQKQFINMVSHEFRTPLTIIDGNAQILNRRADILKPHDIRQRTQTIRSAVSRLVNMMEGVLSSNMLKTGKLELTPEPVDAGELIATLCREHGDLYVNHTINCDVEQLPSRMMLDKKLITLVFSNLLSNAVKFSRENPEITITGYQKGDAVIIEFADSGMGIPANELDHIFDRYYRTTTASGIPGSGIGLNLVRELVTLHHGKIHAESKEEQGTKFVISLPFREN